MPKTKQTYVPNKQLLLKLPVGSVRSDVNELINNTYQALHDIQAVGNTMSRGLQKQYLILQKARRRLNAADSIIIGNVMAEITEACYAVCEAADYFNRKVSTTLRQRGGPAIVKISATNKSYHHVSQGLSASQKTLLNAARNLEKDYKRREVIKAFRTNPSGVAAKLQLPTFLVNLMGYETKLNKSAELYNNIVVSLTKHFSEILSEVNDVREIVLKINPNKYPAAATAIDRVNTDSNMLHDALTNMLTSFTMTRNFFVQQASQNKTTGEKIGGIIEKALNFLKAMWQDFKNDNDENIRKWYENLKQILPANSQPVIEAGQVMTDYQDGSITPDEAADQIKDVIDTVSSGSGDGSYDEWMAGMGY